MVIFNALQTSLSGGIGRYSYELSKAIYLQNSIEFKIVIREEDKKLFKFASDEDLIIVKGIKNSKDRNIFEQFKLPKLIHKSYPNAIIHYPDTMAPLFSKNKVVITVHDLAFKSLKGAFTWKTTLWKNVITELSIKKADKIIAITNFTKEEILKHYKVIESKINVIYNGFNDFSKENIEENKIREKIVNLKKENYILTVSTISPRKNIDGLIKAFDLIKNKIDHKLVVVGKKGWKYDDVFELANKLELGDRIYFTDGVNEDELKYLYKNCELFVYPSFYEGFGLPPLEAMSYGKKIIVSNVTSMPEVCGNSAYYIEPNDIDNIAQMMIDIIDGDQSCKCDLMKSNINKYSWSKCAEEYLKSNFEINFLAQN